MWKRCRCEPPGMGFHTSFTRSFVNNFGREGLNKLTFLKIICLDMTAAFGSRPEPERALASLRRVLRQMRTERVGVCRCAHVYIWMSGCEKRSQLSFNAAQTPLILVLCLSLTGIQSEPRNHLPGSLTLFNICTDMQTQTQIHVHNQ